MNYLSNVQGETRMEYSETGLTAKFQKLKANVGAMGNTGAPERIKRLKSLQTALERSYRDELRTALGDDFGKPVLETDLTEIYQVIREIRHAKRHLRTWMKDRHAGTPVALAGTSSRVRFESKGVCLILAPWNFPVNLTLGPLVSAIAAGNTVLLKPSELTPRTTAVMGRIIAEVFPEDEVALVQGGREVAQALLKLPFHHIFFTGSAAVGKQVMKAASAHLSSVTLELGGKSPTIVDETANLNTAARRIAWGKFLNAGQICVSPDYLLVHEKILEPFLELLCARLIKFYSTDPMASGSYARIVDKKHFARLRSLLEDARAQGARVVIGGQSHDGQRYIAPTVLCDVPENARLMGEEIFGPLLPVIPYRNTGEAIGYINDREKPLAMYIYCRNRKTVAQFINNTRAGSTCINTNVLQYANQYLPFGGTHDSGMGKSHGFYGFQEFSNQRSVLRQHTKSAIEFIFPPYNAVKQRLANFMVNWL